MVNSLLIPYREFLKETHLLLEVVDASPVASHNSSIKTKQRNFAIEMCVVRLHDSWARFCRELVVVSAYAEPLTANGIKVPRIRGVNHRSQVIPTLLATYKKRREEPSWYLARDCIDASLRLQVSNHRTISTGIGLSFPSLSISPNDQIRMVRNFFAHRSRSTASEAFSVASAFSFPAGGNLWALPTTLTPPGITVFAFWVNCLHLMALQSIQ